MAVFLEFINVIISRPSIERRYPGGWEKCISDGMFMWHDDHLLRSGAMNGMDAEMLVGSWRDLGFKVTEKRGGETYWADICIIESPNGVARYKCDWLSVSDDGSYAWLAGTIPGEIAGLDYGTE